MKHNFATLCEDFFETQEVLCNVPYFVEDRGNKWDVDVIIPVLKMAISWNGVWHYKQIRKNQKLAQTQARDLIKDRLIKRTGFQHYIVIDMGRASKKIVKSEFPNSVTGLKILIELFNMLKFFH